MQRSRRPARPDPRKRDLQVENWNLKHPEGTPVIVSKDDGTKHRGVTTSEAYVLGGHSAVIHVSGISGCYLLDRVRPDTDATAEAAAVEG